jgi:hypothetical protein
MYLTLITGFYYCCGNEKMAEIILIKIRNAAASGGHFIT